MRIEYAYFKGYKRFAGSRISELECNFVSPVQIIIGSNSSGKTSLIRELSPLPAVRTDYEKDGIKELRISHLQRMYVLRSDFSNKTAPHSFTLDGEELNVSHTTQVQEDLVVKHFGFTSAVRDLVYGKTKICSMTPSGRKNMFLSLNPMDLSLVADTFHRAIGVFKDCRANVNLLNTRKANLEANMLPEDKLAEYYKDKEKYEKISLDSDKSIYSIEKHISYLKSVYADDLNNYGRYADGSYMSDSYIAEECRRIMRESVRYTGVNRDTYIEDSAACTAKLDYLNGVKNNLKDEICGLRQEADEYGRHLSEVEEHPEKLLEKEISSLEKAVSVYTNLPDNPIPEEESDRYMHLTDKVKDSVDVLDDMGCKMIDPEEIFRLKAQYAEYSRIYAELKDDKIKGEEEEEKIRKEIEHNVARANVPKDCASSSCGLLSLFKYNLSSAEQRLASVKERLKGIDGKCAEAEDKLKNMKELLVPYDKFNAVSEYRFLERVFNSPYFNLPEGESLLNCINHHPNKLVCIVRDKIAGSLRYAEYKKLKDKLDKLRIEYDAVVKSNVAVNTDFLRKQLDIKTENLIRKQQAYKQCISDIKVCEDVKSLYANYMSAREFILELKEKHKKKQQAVIAHEAVKFWTEMLKETEKVKTEAQEKLREIESVIREQEVIKRTYESETLTLLNDISEKKELYRLISFALSPNTGLIHKSMVRYLNSMIDNVNCFISQLWNFRMKIKSISDEEELSYQFPIEIDFETAPDINRLSDGQTEIVDFTWCLAILFQLQLLNTIPLYADELGRACDITHRNKVLLFLNSLIDNSLVGQIFLINHYAALQDGFTNADVICLNDENMGELPADVNRNVRMVKI